jgi:hypothetical protein
VLRRQRLRFAAPPSVSSVLALSDCQSARGCHNSRADESGGVTAAFPLQLSHHYAPHACGLLWYELRPHMCVTVRVLSG